MSKKEPLIAHADYFTSSPTETPKTVGPMVELTTQETSKASKKVAFHTNLVYNLSLLILLFNNNINTVFVVRILQ